MSRTACGTFATEQVRTAVALFAVAFVLLFPQAGRAQVQPLTFFKNYFITGDYVVGGQSLWRKGVHGVANVDVAVTGVPSNVDVVAAFLYVQTAERTPGSGIAHATFQGQNLDTAAGSIAKALNPAGAPPWWGYRAPGWRKMVTYRADVLRFLPVDNTTGRQVVNGLHHIQVPDTGNDDDDDEDGDGAEHPDCFGPHAVGASLVLVYRDPTRPLTAIVISDGLATKRAAETWTQSIQGFYQASQTNPIAKMTHIVGGGRSYLSEKLKLDGQLVATNPFVGSSGPRWDSKTFGVTLPGNAASTTASVEPVGWSSDSLSWSALVFSTTVQDTDGDGLLDAWELPNTLLDPNGRPLPNLAGMGADPNAVSPYQKDLFIEIGYMTADADTTYGAALKPAHTHLPSLQALKMVGDAFKNAPTPIHVHFDVGSNYQIDPETNQPSPYIIPAGTGLARGGDAIPETAGCTAAGGVLTCPGQYPLYPGTVGWKTGFAFLRDGLLNPPPVDPLTGDDPCDAPGNDGLGEPCERRFDRNRNQMFRYALFAHAIGLPKDPCLKKNPDGSEVSPAESDLTCDTPDFHVPRTNSGVGDFPGGDLMVTLGSFPDAAGSPVGTPFMQGATLMHELGHTYELTHAGAPTVPQEPNCKPNYMSVMNYLFQLRGLFNDTQPGVPHMDFSAEVLPGLNETFLSDGTLGGTPRYHAGWYAPQGPGTFGSPAKKYCTGADLPSPLPAGWVPMVRIDSARVPGVVDWNPNPAAPNASFEQDINFDGVETLLNQGTNDWINLHADQLGSRRNVGGFFFDNQGRLVMGPLSLDVGRGDIGRGDIGRGDIGRGDIGRGDIGRGDIGRGDIGRGDIGRGDIGRGDIGRGDIGAGDELDFEIASALGNTPPNEFRACVLGIGPCTGGPLHRTRLDWTPPTVGSVAQYKLYRVNGDTVTPAGAQQVGPAVPSQTGVVAYSAADNEELPNGLFTYFGVAEFADADHTLSGPSNFVTILAVNDAPIAVADAYSTNQGTPLVVPAAATTALRQGVLANDVDLDSPLSLKATVLQPPSHGTVSLNANGSFTYTPDSGFSGSDGFTYSASDVDPSRTSSATVSITVVPVGYEFMNVKNLPPPAGTTFKINASGTMVDLEWRFKMGGVVVNSRDALPSVIVVGPAGAGSTTTTYTPAACGGFAFEYNATTNTWDFDWNPKKAKAGTYYVTVVSGKTGQQFPASGPGFAVVLK